ncbi:MAG: bifunctional hydroxymethylpyrimidine kinase/phosphomethylpyrimidine kinase [SAR202 cluster bacterium]|nr:bifunctional hydroxymethylpyrimidine kinase/phosphomethylpyrimidine kinase [SAR202 cluster bacterium]
MIRKSVARVMTIAGSDSGGGAGIQADLKAFAAMGAYGTCVITAITAQNTVRVTDVLEVPDAMIRAQIDAVMSDIGTDAAKTGMLASAAIINTVAEKIREHAISNLVVDPVMVAKSGDRLLREDAIDVLRRVLIPLATVVTPNLPEAEAITGRVVKDLDQARDAARMIVEEMGAKAAVVKGGHMPGPATDTFYDGTEVRLFTAQRVSTTNTHGTGCTFASAVAGCIARGMPLKEAVGQSKKYVTEAIRSGIAVGHGSGPLNHFYKWWE